MPTADGPETTLLSDDHGVPLATFRWRDEDGERVVGRFLPQPGVSPDRAARQAVHDLAGCRLTSPEEAVARALIGAGCTLLRGGPDMQRGLREPIPVTPMPAGWALIRHDWDDDLARALTAAYGPDHPDRGDRVGRLRG